MTVKIMMIETLNPYASLTSIFKKILHGKAYSFLA